MVKVLRVLRKTQHISDPVVKLQNRSFCDENTLFVFKTLNVQYIPDDIGDRLFVMLLISTVASISNG